MTRAAAAFGRARRRFLLGEQPPFLASFAPKRALGGDAAEAGVAAVRFTAIWKNWEELDAGLARLCESSVLLEGDRLDASAALARLAEEGSRRLREELAASLARALRPAARDLADSWALVVDDAA